MRKAWTMAFFLLPQSPNRPLRWRGSNGGWRPLGACAHESSRGRVHEGDGRRVRRSLRQAGAFQAFPLLHIRRGRPSRSHGSLGAPRSRRCPRPSLRERVRSRLRPLAPAATRGRSAPFRAPSGRGRVAESSPEGGVHTRMVPASPVRLAGPERGARALKQTHMRGSHRGVR